MPGQYINVPLFKGGDASVCSNYRPITTLPVLSKIFEKLIFFRMNSFIVKYDILVPFQYGFRSGSSTADALLEYMNRVYDTINNKQLFCTILLDFKKAFDCVDHNILLGKLERLGFRSTIHNLLRSYLTNRKQVVTINGERSAMKAVVRGIPQGSTLGPLLFLLYVNDMSNCSDSLSFIHFADDTTVSCIGNNVPDVLDLSERELRNVEHWLTANRLSLNASKSAFMINTNKDIPLNLGLTLSNSVIEQVTFSRFLGVMIDGNMKFSHHIDKLSNTLSRVTGILRRASSFVPSRSMRTLYNCVFYPHLIYGITVWGSAGTTLRNRIQVIQNRAVRLISPSLNTNDCYTANKLLKLDDVYVYFLLVKIFYIIKLGNNSYFTNIIQNCLPNHSHNTRYLEDDLFIPPFYCTSGGQNSFLYRGIKYWNELSAELRSVPDVSVFKRRLKTFLLNQAQVE